MNPHRCEVCPSYPCWKLVESSKTISGGTLEITMRKLLENFTGVVGCEYFPKSDTVEIVITKRRDDYHVQIKGHPEWWESGSTAKEAVMNLVNTRFKMMEP